jgi:acrylyl-CoA reductase (NADPH)
MKAIRIDKTDGGSIAAFGAFDEGDLMDGDVTVRVSHSSLNYKDGLAITGKAPVVRRFPMIPGVDFAGVVETSAHPSFKPGDPVLLTGWGVGETHLGGYAERARVDGDWLTPLPEGLGPSRAMAIGTAGLTAMLALMALERHGAEPSDGDLIVTGAAGGLGSVAVTLAARAGWRVVASTGRPNENAYLKDLGAAEIVDRAELSGVGKPLGKERWAAAIDVAGSHTLANLLAQMLRHGAVAACGLAQGMDLPTTVAPFILRGVALLGIDSVHCPSTRRVEAWGRLARELDLDKLDDMTRTIGLSQTIDEAPRILSGQIRGRTVVEIAR